MHKSITARSGKIAVTENGAGPATVLLLHGNSGCRNTFASQIEMLSGRYHVVALDYAGHGDSADAERPTRDYTLAGHAATAEDILHEIGVGPLVIVGVSLGGHVALEMTAAPLDVRGLVLVGCPPYAKSAEGLAQAFKPGPGLALAGKEAFTSEDVEVFLDLVGPGPEEARSTYRKAMQRTDGRARTAMVSGLLTPEARDQRQLAENLAAPIALINGADDAMVELDYIESLSYRRLWRGKGHRIATAAHSPHTSHADQFNELLSEFIEAVA